MQRKIAMQSGWKHFGYILCIGMLLASISLLVWKLCLRKPISQTIPVNSYTATTEMTTCGILKPNSVYRYNKIETNCYPTALLQQLAVPIQINLVAQKKAMFGIKYKVIAQVYGMGPGNDITKLWTYEETLLPEQMQTGWDHKIQMQEVIQIEPDRYEQLAKRAVAETKVPMKTYLNIQLYGEASVKTEDSTDVQPIRMDAVVELQQPVWNVQMNGKTTKREQVTEQAMVLPELPLGDLVGCICIMLLSGTGLLLLTVKTKPLGREERLNRCTKKILRQYGNHMIALRTEMQPDEYYLQYEVSDIRDLIRIAKEIEHPIFYLISEEHQSIVSENRFYVQTDSTRFVYQIE